MTHDARLTRERDFHNERFGAVEERKQDSFYFAAQPAMDAYWRLARAACPGREVLEYGCSNGMSSIGLARFAKRITGIDISDVAVQQATNAAVRRGISNVTFQVDNAENMNLPSAGFDVVFGSGILHHLVLEKALGEVRRVLRPGGKAFFFEPLGHNPVINLYRNWTPTARTVDEHPLLKSDFEIVRKHFSNCDLEFFALATLASIPFRRSPLGAAIRAVGKQIDMPLLKIPGAKWQAWIVVMALEA
ncbi:MULTISPECIES: class I SAM-dependent methyltransferase [Rhizobium]|uniref:SAM-dependent methyltransferase n=1 Tax=Rhizobium paranaense TaxID=1650438 RepID=A0A7W8XNF9_9HYPH|nr:MULTISPECIES: class I SAM-dependent methyltransferase [Rhizobium]MBB5572551.1 SAM-dependent methyltransferase [Rhizobium paranaense]PST63585.1 class I SAM-dependent methyltransferase [Rhizobium sp. SEMIA4064]